jgi:GDP-L-fucose synthase
MYALAGKRVWVAGHNGMVGSAIVRRLAQEDCEVLTVERSAVNLIDQAAVRAWVADTKPDAVFLAAAKVGGILANDSLPADFLYDNLMIEANVIEAAHRAGVEKLLFLGSSCIYPKFAPQPIVEDALLTGPLEPTNEWYAIAKIMATTSSRRCRRTSTARATTLISAPAMWSRRSCARHTKPSWRARTWSSGARAPHAANSCTSMIAPMPASS